jgi:hypothetical protein
MTHSIRIRSGLISLVVALSLSAPLAVAVNAASIHGVTTTSTVTSSTPTGTTLPLPALPSR